MTALFEEELQTLTQRQFVLPTSSGSTAIIASLIASGIPPHSEVIIPSICCAAVLFAINLAGFTPVLADVSKEDFCMDTENIASEMSSKTKAIIAIHSYGRYCKIQEIQNFSEENGLFLIEDACLGLGGMINEKPFGSFGGISIFSFGYDKIIDAGGGGALVTENVDLFQKAQAFLRNNRYFSYQGDSEHLNFIKRKLNTLPEAIKIRNTNAKIYHEHLSQKKFSKPPFKENIVYWRYSALYEGNRNLLVESAKKEGVIITAHYKGLHQLRTGEVLPNSELISNQIINLFVKPETPSEQIHKTISFINEFEDNSLRV